MPAFLRHWPRRAAAVLAVAWATAGAHAAELAIAVGVAPQSLPLYLAEKNGYFAAEGLQVRLLDCIGGDACLKRMFAGESALATSSELPVVLHAFDRADFAILATFVSAQVDAQVVARRSAGIARAEQLAGKRVAVIPSSSAHYFFDAFMLFHGVDPNAVQQVRMKIEDTVPALEKGEVDAIVAYSRQGWSAMKSLGADGVVLPDPRLYTQTFNLVATRDAITGRPAELVKLLRALHRAERAIADQPDAARELLRTRLKLDAGFADQVLRNFTYRLGLEPSLSATMAGEQRWAVREGHVPPNRPVRDTRSLVEPGPLKAALPALSLR